MRYEINWQHFLKSRKCRKLYTSIKSFHQVHFPRNVCSTYILTYAVFLFFFAPLSFTSAAVLSYANFVKFQNISTLQLCCYECKCVYIKDWKILLLPIIIFIVIINETFLNKTKQKLQKYIYIYIYNTTTTTNSNKKYPLTSFIYIVILLNILQLSLCLF
jgi:hypothetical protein